MSRNKTIKFKLFMISLSFIFSLVASVGIGVWQMNKSGEELIEIAELKIPLVKILTQATIHQLEATIEFEKYLREHKEESKAIILELASKTKDEVNEAKNLIANNIELSISKKDKAKLLGYIEELQDIYNEEIKLNNEYQKLFSIPPDKKDEIRGFEIFVEKHATELSKKIEELIIIIEEDTVQVAIDAERNELLAIKLILTLGIVLTILSSILATVFGKKINKEIFELSKKISQLSNTISQVSSNLLKSSKESLSLVTQQDSNLEETSVSAEQIKKIAEKNFSHAEKSKEKTQTVETNIQNTIEGSKKLNIAIAGISNSTNKLKEQSLKSSAEIDLIRNLMLAIQDKIKVINDIVFQTKLLSFNASVEAARAGESGKGFAVVAEEVGNLANVSGEAAQDINDLLDSSVERVQKVTDKIKTNSEKLSAESKLNLEKSAIVFEESSESVDSVSREIEAVTDLINESVNASEEQLAGVQKINKMLINLSESSRRSKDLTQQNNDISVNLAKLMDEFNTIKLRLSHLSGSE